MPHRRNPKAGFFRELERSPQPVYILDSQRRIVFANQACADWVGTPREQFVGQTCNYHSRSDADLSQRITASLCPPPDAFEGRTCAATVGGYLIELDSGDSHRAKQACFWPVATNESSFMVISVVDPLPGQASSTNVREERNAAPAELHEALVQWRRDASATYRLDRLVGTSPAMRTVQRVAKAAIASGADTLVVGPPGGGMESLARAIHFSQYSAGNAPPLIPVDCSTCDPESLQSALRHVRSDREHAAKGRLLLLQADRINPDLLNELSGFVSLPHFDIGLLSTSERSLRALAQRQEFDPGVALHLSTLEIHLPPLSERLQDLALLCQASIEDFNAEGNHQLAGIHPDALETLCQYEWPGNVDELAQVVQAAARHASGTLIQPADLPKQIRQGISAGRIPRPSDEKIDLTAFLQEIENELMRRAMRVSKGNKAKAARLLGISRQRMIRWSGIQSSHPPE